MYLYSIPIPCCLCSCDDSICHTWLTHPYQLSCTIIINHLNSFDAEINFITFRRCWISGHWTNNKSSVNVLTIVDIYTTLRHSTPCWRLMSTSTSCPLGRFLSTLAPIVKQIGLLQACEQPSAGAVLAQTTNKPVLLESWQNKFKQSKHGMWIPCCPLLFYQLYQLS